MGVISECIESTLAIPAKKAPDALRALRKGLKDLFSDRDLELANNLQHALSLLDMDCDVDDAGNLSNIRFAGGKGDNSTLVFPHLAPYIVDGGSILMEHDGERERTTFHGGSFGIEAEDDFDEDYDDDDYDEDEEELSEAVDEFFSKIEEGEVTVADVEAIYASEGNLDFVDYCSNTPLVALLSCIENADYEAEQAARGDADEREGDPWRDVMEAMLRCSPDLDAIGEDGDTALGLLIRGGHLPEVERLLDAGASLTGKGAGSALSAACHTLKPPVVELLRARGLEVADSDALVAATCEHEHREEKLDFIRFLVEQCGVDVNRPAASAYCSYDGELAKRATPLMVAAQTDDIAVLRYYLERGAEVNARDADGNTALMHCCGQTWVSGGEGIAWSRRKHNAAVVRALLEAGAEVGARNKRGESAYDIARKENRPGLELLREHIEASGGSLPVEITDDFTGTITYRKAGEKAYEVRIENGKLNGEQRFFTETGAVHCSVNYDAGTASGECRVWYDDGTPCIEATLVDGKPHGEVRVFTKAGEQGLVARFENGRFHGEQVMYGDDGEVAMSGCYVKGVKEGRFFCRKGDKVLIDQIFKDGVPESEPEKDETKGEGGGLVGLLTGLIGTALSKEMLIAESMEEKFNPLDKLVYHRPKKVLAIVAKTQSRLI